MDWLSTRGRVCCRGRETRGRWLFRGTRLRSLFLSLTSSLLSCYLLILLAQTHRRSRARAHAHLSGWRASLFTGPRTEKQDGDLWDGAGRRHPFNGLPKRLNFVADPLLSAPGDPGAAAGARFRGGAEPREVIAAVKRALLRKVSWLTSA